MSVLVTMRIEGDTEQFRRWVTTEEDFIRKISDDARARGAIHHRFGVGEGFVLIIDEWESVDAFQQFFGSNPDIGRAMQEAGARSEPVFTFAEAIETADQF